MHRFDLVFPPGPRRACRVRVGRGALDGLLQDLVAEAPGRRLIVISDSNVAPLHALPLARRLKAAGLDVVTLEFPAGEANKTRATKAQLEDQLLELRVGRDSALIAVGGGVTGDLVGFVAATWHRGIPVVQVPTSSLAMADAALGGKTGVDLPAGKNLVGAFHQPWGIFADIDTLKTLPESDFREGFAEVVKSAAVADASLFRWLQAHTPDLLNRDSDALTHAFSACMEIKARVVRADEREAGRRAILNFGHTVAHAIEAVTDFEVRHGPAVAIGMCVEADLAREATGLSAAACRRLEALLEALGLPVRLPAGISVDAVVEATRLDKKTRGSVVHYALPKRLGRMLPGAEVTQVVGAGTLGEALQRRLT